MAVPCPSCGRDYDIALFQFGRTIDCTCGARVALAPRVRPLVRAANMRFIVDAMLGRLARWLRLLGCDAEYDASIRDADLVRRAIEEDRVVLTRDRAVAEEWSVPRLLIVESEALDEQLRQVVHAFDLDWSARLFARCSRCNAELDEVARDAVAARLPPRVLQEQQHFVRCPHCDRIYWGGSHVARMRRAIESALGPDS